MITYPMEIIGKVREIREVKAARAVKEAQMAVETAAREEDGARREYETAVFLKRDAEALRIKTMSETGLSASVLARSLRDQGRLVELCDERFTLLSQAQQNRFAAQEAQNRKQIELSKAARARQSLGAHRDAWQLEAHRREESRIDDNIDESVTAFKGCNFRRQP